MQNVGKYQIVEKIGVGGFGEVYKGYDPFIKRPVAVKTCTSDDEEIRNRFFQEAEIAGNLHHRNITTVYDFGIQDGLPYLIQEYLSGEDLDRKIKRREFLPHPEKLYYLLQIARGLAYAHAAGVIHRDIKPANVRILEDGTAKIMDFGIAKLAQSQTGLTQTGMTLGTAAYLAPEQIRGEGVDPRTDLFSFGVMAYELLTYERPFQGEQISAVLYQILHQEATPIREYLPDAPADIVQLIERCLKKDSVDRYESGAELLRELEIIQKRGRPGSRDDGADVHGDETRVMPTPPPPEGSALQTRPALAIPVERTPTSSRSLDELELSAVRQDGLTRHQATPVETSASAILGSRAMRASSAPWRTAALLGGLAVVALLAGWWLGRPRPRDTPDPKSSGPSGRQAPPSDATTDVGSAPGAAGAETGATGPSSGPPPREPADEVADIAATAPPPSETPSVEPVAPPPPAPRPGVVIVEALKWAPETTVEVGSQPQRPLNRDREFVLEPGTYTVLCDLRTQAYSARKSFQVTIGEAERKAIACPIPPPAVVMVRARLGRAQGEVAIDGRPLGKSPVEASLGPGEHQVLIQPQAGSSGTPITEMVSLAPDSRTMVSFDLSTGTATVKELTP